MILQCSNCNGRYLVPDHAIGKDGRNVRCARCKHTWFAELPAPKADAAPLPPLEEMLSSINNEPEIPVKPLAPGANLPVYRKEKASITLKAMTILMLALVMLLGVYIYSPTLMLPSSNGLVLADIKMQKSEDGIAAEINGNIINSGDTDHEVPTMRIMLLDEANNPIQFWEYGGNGKIMKPKEALPFSSGALGTKSVLAKNFLIELGTPLELSIRRKPQ